MDREALLAANRDLIHPYCRIGEFGDGWLEILADVFSDLRQVQAVPRITQIKEKLGALRIYFEDRLHPAAKAVAARAYDRSEQTCELCGNPGELRRNLHDMKTLCDGCLGQQ